MVLLELSVDERGLVRRSRPVHDVAPFTDLVRESAMSWRFDPARENRSRTESRVLVIGLYRPPAMLFALPETPKPPPTAGSDNIPFPTEVVVPPYPPNRIGSANVLLELEVREDESGLTVAHDHTNACGNVDGSPALLVGSATPGQR